MPRIRTKSLLASAVMLVMSAGAARAQSVPVAPLSFDVGDMIRSAEPVVRAVMVLLAFLSLMSWAVLFAKERALRQRGGALQSDLAALASARRIEDLSALDSAVLRRMADTSRDELEQSRHALAAGLGDGVAGRIGLKLRTIEDAESRQLSHGLGLLANVGANAPFIGLLGTVWGIMHAFIGIAQTKSTSLAVVAPGIAEALFTTALGLAAAIPATIMYNVLGRRMVGYRARMEAAISAVLCLVSLRCEEARLADTHAGRA